MANLFIPILNMNIAVTYNVNRVGVTSQCFNVFRKLIEKLVR